MITNLIVGLVEIVHPSLAWITIPTWKKRTSIFQVICDQLEEKYMQKELHIKYDYMNIKLNKRHDEFTIVFSYKCKDNNK